MAFNGTEPNKQALLDDTPDSYHPQYSNFQQANSSPTAGSVYPDDSMNYHQNSFENHSFEGMPGPDNLFVINPNQSMNSMTAAYGHPLDNSIAYNRSAFGYPPNPDALSSSISNGLQNVANANALSFSDLRMNHNSLPRNASRVHNNSPHYGSSNNFGHQRQPGVYHPNHYPSNNPNRRPMQKKSGNQSNRFQMNQQSNCSKIGQNLNCNLAACHANCDQPPMNQQQACNRNYGYPNGQMNGQVSGQLGGQVAGQVSGQVNGQANGHHFDYNPNYQNHCDTPNRCDLNNNFGATNFDTALEHCGAANCCSTHSQCHYKTGQICDFGLNCCATKDFICNSNVKIDFRRNTFNLNKYNFGAGQKQPERNSPGLQVNRSGMSKPSNERTANLRSFRPSNKNKQPKLASSLPDLALVIEQCFEQLNELRKERTRLCKLAGKSSGDALSSSFVFAPGKTGVEDVIKFATEEYDELAKWFDGLIDDLHDGKSANRENEILKTSNYSFLLWYANVQAVDYAYKRSLVKLDENKISSTSMFDANAERVNDSSDLQCFVQLQQVPRTTKEVRKSLWCLSTVRTHDF